MSMIELHRGSVGREVSSLQLKLRTLGLYRGPVDGDYGPKTVKAVRDFQQRYLVDGEVDSVTYGALERVLDAWNSEKVTPFKIPRGRLELERVFGHIEYINGNEKWGPGEGWVTITNDWAKEYLLRAELPLVGSHFVNRIAYPSLRLVLELIAERGLEIKQFACWAPRHQLHKPQYPLSTHSWAIAADINWSDNPLSSGEGQMDPGIVQAFELHGWVWGGRWRNSDPMHFQLCTDY